MILTENILSMENDFNIDLLLKYYSGQCSDTEKALVDEWRFKSEENARIFEEYKLIWENSSTKNVLHPNVEEALNKVNAKLGYIGVKQGKTIKMVRYSWAVAASILVIIGTYFAVTLTLKPVETVLIVAKTTLSEQRLLTLPDSTQVWLNKNSQLTYPKHFEGKIRKVTLEGEAYFEVAKNPEKPFVIETEKSVTKVLGTCFNVRARKNESKVEVVVTEGKVAFSEKEKKEGTGVKLLPGDKGILNVSTGEVVTEKNTDPNFLAWKTRKLVFENVPIYTVANKLAEFYAQPFDIKQLHDTSLTLTATFDDQQLGEVLKVIEMTLGIHVDSTDNVVHFKN